MAKREKKVVKIKSKKIISEPINDGTNSPVPDAGAVQVTSESETALFKQAGNPLGDPDKI